MQKFPYKGPYKGHSGRIKVIAPYVGVVGGPKAMQMTRKLVNTNDYERLHVRHFKLTHKILINVDAEHHHTLPCRPSLLWPT